MKREVIERLAALERRINTGDHINHVFVDLVAPGSNGPQSLKVLGYEARFMNRDMAVLRGQGESLEDLQQRCQEYAGQNGQDGCSMWLAITPNEIQR
jgi:hypothetical protein